MTTTPISSTHTSIYVYRHGMYRNVASYNEKGTWLAYNTSGIMDVILYWNPLSYIYIINKRCFYSSVKSELLFNATISIISNTWLFFFNWWSNATFLKVFATFFLIHLIINEKLHFVFIQVFIVEYENLFDDLEGGKHFLMALYVQVFTLSCERSELLRWPWRHQVQPLLSGSFRCVSSSRQLVKENEKELNS